LGTSRTIVTESNATVVSGFVTASLSCPSGTSLVALGYEIDGTRVRPSAVLFNSSTAGTVTGLAVGATGSTTVTAYGVCLGF
jgi:hypothetical protein